MRFEHVNRYEARPQEVYAMLTDAAFRERVCEAVHSPHYDVAVTGDGDAVTVRIEQAQHVRKVPSFATKLVGDTIEIHQREHWSAPTTADFETTIPGKPGHLKGTVTLEESDGVTVQRIAGELKVSVPLVGGKLENVIAGLLSMAMDAEERTGRAWLAGER